MLDSGGRHQLIVTAYLANGRREDITEQVRYVSENPGGVDVNDTGLVQAKKTGETNVLVRAAGGNSLSATVGVVEKPIVNYPKVEARNYIDRFVFAKLRNFQILPSELSSDEEFLRRVCLDLTGTLPPPKRVREFLAEKNPRKRGQLIEILLNSPEYGDYWGFRFSDLMRATFTTSNSTKGTKAYEDWIINSVVVQGNSLGSSIPNGFEFDVTQSNTAMPTYARSPATYWRSLSSTTTRADSATQGR